jgi:hypothetical protein
MRNLFIILLVGAGLSATAQITVQPYTIEMRADIDKLAEIPPIVATSPCGAISSSHEDLMFSGGCLGNLVRTYVFTDDCGNTARAQQFLILDDKVPPVMSEVAPTLTASLSSIPEVVEVTATDNSKGEIEIVYNETKEKDRIIRTWTAQDQCGNTSIMKQVIELSGM